MTKNVVGSDVCEEDTFFFFFNLEKQQEASTSLNKIQNT